MRSIVVTRLTSNCWGLIVVRPPFFSPGFDDGIALGARSMPSFDPSDSCPDFPLVGWKCDDSSISSLSVPLIRRLFGVEMESGVAAIWEIDEDSIDGPSVLLSFSLRIGVSWVFFLLGRELDDFFFSPAGLLLLLRDLLDFASPPFFSSLNRRRGREGWETGQREKEQSYLFIGGAAAAAAGFGGMNGNGWPGVGAPNAGWKPYGFG